MMKKGFTLAEVLITLAILGVVAALTIPGLIANTQGRQYSVAYRKAVATFGQAINKSVGLDGVDMSNLSDAKKPGTDDQRYANGSMVEFAKQNLNVQRVEGNHVFLADGTQFYFPQPTATCTAGNPCVVGVDVNGVGSPNAVYRTGVGKLTDRFVMVVTDVTAMPFPEGGQFVNPDDGSTTTVGVTGLTGSGKTGFAVDANAAGEAAAYAMTGKTPCNKKK